MRIAFICGSLAPGRDGVGDYCRRLGLELKRLGHDILLLSANDRWHTGISSEPEKSMSVLRCSSATPINQRAEAAGTALRKFGPDWVSLQYVCYGFHPRGLAWRWNSVFAGLGQLAPRRHLMLHELWIGPPPAHRRLIGWAQQWVVRDLQSRFKPDSVTTSMKSYQRRVERIGIRSTVLPLFGNISMAPRDDRHVASQLCAAGSQRVQQPRATFLNGVFFGTLHPDFNVTGFLRWLAELLRRSTRPVLLTMIGRTGMTSQNLARQIVSTFPEQVEVISLGEQPEATISQVLQFADFGINTGSPGLFGKSGTAAAMREHGLPVVLGDGELDYAFVNNPLPPVLQFSTEGSVMSLLDYQRSGNSADGVARRALDFICLLETAVSQPEPSLHLNHA